MHRRVFGVLSMLPRRVQGAALRKVFEWKYRTPDPFGACTEGDSGRYQQYKYRATLEQARRHLATPGRILDAGCGEGHFLAHLAEHFPDARLHGVDISPCAVRRAGELLGERAQLRAVDIVSDDLDGQYDMIFCAEVLYYLGGDRRSRQVVERLRSLLVSGGLLVLQHPWPEARLLHLDFDFDHGLRNVDELVDYHEHRPFAVTVYRRPAAETSLPVQRARGAVGEPSGRRPLTFARVPGRRF
jgi:SAM-dependent methyltransferase